MTPYSRSRLSNDALLCTIRERVATDRRNTAEFLADLAEVDARQLYRDAGFPSLSAWCIGALHLSEETTAKRIFVARAARRFPQILEAIAEGRLNLSAVVQLGGFLQDPTVGAELLAAAAHKTREGIAHLLAERFPQPAPSTRIDMVASETLAFSQQVTSAEHSPGNVPVERTKVAPLAPDVYLLKGAMTGEMRELLRYLQSLLGYAGRDEMHVLHLGLQALKPVLEKRKFRATARPRPDDRRRSSNPHYIPAHVKRAVWERDGGQCTFVSADGHRCQAHSGLHYDHKLPAGKEGKATVANVRLLCAAHNQLAAEREYGYEFMRHRRTAERERRQAERDARQRQADAVRELRAAQAEADREDRRRRQARLDAEREARRAQADKERAERDARRRQVELERQQERERAELAQDPERSVVPWLRKLGFSLAEARRAVDATAHLADAPLAHRVKAACRVFAAPLIATRAASGA